MYEFPCADYRLLTSIYLLFTVNFLAPARLLVRQVTHWGPDMNAVRETSLEALNMEMRVGLFDREHLSEVAGLFRWCRQFNLTGRRLSRDECQALNEDDRFLPLSVSLRDRAGEYGVISVAVLEVLEDEIAIRDWLVSGQLLDRGIELAVMNLIFEIAGQVKVSRVTGDYRPTERNGIVRNVFVQFGFEHVFQNGSHTGWTRPVQSYVAARVFIRKLL